MIGTESGGVTDPADAGVPDRIDGDPAPGGETPPGAGPVASGVEPVASGVGATGWQVRRHGPRWRLPPMAAAALVVVLAVGVFLAVRGGSPDGGTVEARPTPETVAPWPTVAGPSAMAPPFAQTPGLDPRLSGPPTRVRIKRIGVDSGLEGLRLDAKGELRPPTDYGRAGWYSDGTAPGDIGPAVIAGHVNSYQGPGVFVRLAELKPGDLVEVARGATVVTFRVYSVEHHPKSRFPTAQVYSPTPDAQLRLITCGGEFDQRARSYNDNVVAYAVVA